MLVRNIWTSNTSRHGELSWKKIHLSGQNSGIFFERILESLSPLIRKMVEWRFVLSFKKISNYPFTITSRVLKCNQGIGFFLFSLLSWNHYFSLHELTFCFLVVLRVIHFITIYDPVWYLFIIQKVTWNWKTTLFLIINHDSRLHLQGYFLISKSPVRISSTVLFFMSCSLFLFECTKGHTLSVSTFFRFPSIQNIAYTFPLFLLSICYWLSTSPLASFDWANFTLIFTDNSNLIFADNLIIIRCYRPLSRIFRQ